jgi:hypothetical protein
VVKRKKTVKRTAGKVSKRKGTGGKKSRGPASSGKGAEQVGNLAGGQRHNDGAPATAALRSLANLPAPVASELAGILSTYEHGTTREISFPVYGNYCGFGHGDPTGQTPPIDMVDAVCREHDMCYESLGDFEPWCDLELIYSMPDAIARTPSPLGKQAGVLALLYFAVAERNLALGETLFKRT